MKGIQLRGRQIVHAYYEERPRSAGFKYVYPKCDCKAWINDSDRVIPNAVVTCKNCLKMLRSSK